MLSACDRRRPKPRLKENAPTSHLPRPARRSPSALQTKDRECPFRWLRRTGEIHVSIYSAFQTVDRALHSLPAVEGAMFVLSRTPKVFACESFRVIFGLERPSPRSFAAHHSSDAVHWRWISFRVPRGAGTSALMKGVIPPVANKTQRKHRVALSLAELRSPSCNDSPRAEPGLTSSSVPNPDGATPAFFAVDPGACCGELLGRFDCSRRTPTAGISKIKIGRRSA
jgi:hypothetical protein